MGKKNNVQAKKGEKIEQKRVKQKNQKYECESCGNIIFSLSNRPFTDCPICGGKAKINKFFEGK